jgi:hypothetical protein
VNSCQLEAGDSHFQIFQGIKHGTISFNFKKLHQILPAFFLLSPFSVCWGLVLGALEYKRYIKEESQTRLYIFWFKQHIPRPPLNSAPWNRRPDQSRRFRSPSYVSQDLILINTINNLIILIIEVWSKTMERNIVFKFSFSSRLTTSV